MVTKVERIMLPLVVVVSLVVLVSSRESIAAKPFYEGKRITIVVGFEPGGGYDRMARILARHLPKHIPGKPGMLVQNMAGASSLVAANYLYNVASPDGLTFGTINRGIPFAQLTKLEAVKCDVMKFAWIGSPVSEATVFCVRADSPYMTWRDLLKATAPIPFGSTGAGESSTQFALICQDYLGFKLKIVGYILSTDALLAIERKEVDARSGSFSSLKQYIDRGLIRPLIRGSVSDKGMENVPVNEDLTTDPRGKTIMAMLSAADRVGRPYIAPPGTPADKMNILRDAFANVSKDPEFVEDCRKNGLSVQYTPAEACLKAIGSLLNQPEDITKEFKKYVIF